MKFRPLNLGDILEKVFIVSGKSLSRTIIISAVIMLPAAIILAFGISYFFNNLLYFTERINHYGYDYSPYEIVRFVLIYLISILSASLFNLAGYLGTTKIFSTQFQNIKANIGEGFKAIFSNQLISLVIFVILVSAAISALLSVPILLLIYSAITDLPIVTFFAVILLLGAIAAIIYFSVKWIFLIPILVIDRLGLISALRKSANLVKGYWWRTFGIYLLVSFIIQIAISIITTPLSFVIFLDLFLEIIKSATQYGGQFNNPYYLLEYFSDFGLRLGLLSWVSYVAQLCILPCLHVVMYFDLVARKTNTIEYSSDEENKSF